MRVVVTGATSMIGVALIQKCIESGDVVLAIVRKKTTRLNRLPKSELLQIEYADLNSLANVKGDGKTYDVFYHFAWDHTVKEERDLPLAQEENICSSLEAVKLADRLGCRKYIGAGSQAEYGSIRGVIDEKTTCNPQMAYGIAKLSANLLTRKMCEQLGITHIWGRIFSVYGCNDNEGTMLDYAIAKFLKNQPVQFSEATQVWNYLYEEDAGMMFYLLGKKDVSAGIYCVASNESKHLKEYINEAYDVCVSESVCEYILNDQQVELINLEVDISKIVSAINYVPQVSFKEGIERIVKHMEMKQI